MDIETVRSMRHAIGLDYKNPKRGKYEAWRNYVMDSRPNKIWESLVEQGYAKLYISKREDWIPKESYYYSLTRTGLDLMESMIGAKITERN